MRKALSSVTIGLLLMAASALGIVLWGHPHRLVPELAIGCLTLALAILALYF